MSNNLLTIGITACSIFIVAGIALIVAIPKFLPKYLISLDKDDK